MYPSMVGRVKDQDWKTNKHMGCPNTDVLPMDMFRRMEGNSIGRPMIKEHWRTHMENVSKYSRVKAIEVILLVVSLHAEGVPLLDSTQ